MKIEVIGSCYNGTFVEVDGKELKYLELVELMTVLYKKVYETRNDQIDFLNHNITEMISDCIRLLEHEDKSSYCETCGDSGLWLEIELE